MVGSLPKKGVVGYCINCPITAVINYFKFGSLKTTEIYSLTVLEARNLKSQCWQGRTASEGSRGTLAPCLSGFLCLWHSLALNPALCSILSFFLCVCVCLPLHLSKLHFPLSYKKTCDGISNFIDICPHFYCFLSLAHFGFDLLFLLFVSFLG